MPDGTPRKLVDIRKLSGLGWKATTTLDNGLKQTYENFLTKIDDGTHIPN